MAKATLKKKVEDEQATAFSEVKLYARKIWLAGLGAYAKANQEGTEYVKELIKTGEKVEKDAKKAVDEKLEAANSEIDSIKGEVSGVKGRVEAQFDKIESAFDRRVAKGLNRIGIPSKHDVETLSAKLDELTALLERVGPKKLERNEPKKLERIEPEH
ncbi:phasin family protein [Pseudomonas cichorii]|uniref:phasin family protein n=1 Tax=Pseudomonas cichorii TaxID=36746 RepID=UPI001C8A6153|nr:phasin family protein [Pseudomonas cichorii]MBX8486098.1 phasin family protein [Pseudomonas cichorii]MBX8515834.1 phasin family protein [Pseudomonas cichorii]MBX8556676.1 phasin family protein [Pseudomonas cichorii]MBX8574966.1 phasin family protein [Pseudomonas cichorii]